MKYDPHKSSLFDLDANLAAILVYLLPWMLSIISNTLGSVAWIIPLLALVMESKSDFVNFHAANSLAFFSINALIHFISVAFGIGAALTSWMSNMFVLGFFFSGIRSMIAIVLGIIFAVIEIYLAFAKIYSLIKAYDYNDVNIPGISLMTRFILNLKR